VVIGIIVLRIVLRLALSNVGGKGGAGQQAPVVPAPVPGAVAVSAPAPVQLDGPIALPAFPDLGPGQEIAPGVVFYEIRLPGGPRPGFGGKLWLYLPSGGHADKSLPCVLITGAGSNLLVGMDLGDGDRPEHLPYVRAGFAVLAFALDGAMPNRQGASDAQIFATARKFLAARAGLVNAHIALEYALAKVQEIDPQRIYVAGHSSAGTLALLFAEQEPRLKGCVAFAPAIDLAQRFGPAASAIRQNGLGDLVDRFSPKTNESKLSCPLFLFHAQDDSNIPISSSQEWAQRLSGMGKTVTFETVPTGNHYDSMIQQGIPRAIGWLQDRAGMARTPAAVAAPAPAPGVAPTPPPASGGFPQPPGAPPRMMPRPPRMGPPPGFGPGQRRPRMRPGANP
jgi:dienelactone hydrolase